MYNTYMKSIIIDGAERAIRAGTWAEAHLKEWSLEMVNPLSKAPQYAFSFRDPHDATLFALKWR